MREFISSTSFSTLVNASPSLFFKLIVLYPLSYSLLRQNCEALGALLGKTKNVGMIGGFQTSQNGEVITHLQFANNTILFSSTKWEENLALRRILLCFSVVFGFEG